MVHLVIGAIDNVDPNVIPDVATAANVVPNVAPNDMDIIHMLI